MRGRSAGRNGLHQAHVSKPTRFYSNGKVGRRAGRGFQKRVIILAMHEMSIAANIVDIAREELGRRGLRTLTRVEVRCGALSNVVADSLQLCFEALTAEGPFAGARLDVVEVPLVLRCRSCGKTFAGTEGQASLWLPCPLCGAEPGHTVEQGREFFIQQLEAE